MTTSAGSFIRTWSYLVNETVTFDRRKAALAWWNQVCGSAGQNSVSFTATALMLTVGGAGAAGLGMPASAAWTACCMCSCIAASNSCCCCGDVNVWPGWAGWQSTTIEDFCTCASLQRLQRVMCVLGVMVCRADLLLYVRLRTCTGKREEKKSAREKKCFRQVLNYDGGRTRGDRRRNMPTVCKRIVQQHNNTEGLVLDGYQRWWSWSLWPGVGAGCWNHNNYKKTWLDWLGMYFHSNVHCTWLAACRMSWITSCSRRLLTNSAWRNKTCQWYSIE
jgi:hypothetical protein